ncbi:MAG: sensor histidine kinase [Pseudomonadota bacterium]
MTSINQNDVASGLPNFRNLGVLARILAGVNVLAFAAAVAQAPDLSAVVAEFVGISVVLQPALILTVVALYALQPYLPRFSYPTAVIIVVSVALFATAAVNRMVALEFTRAVSGDLLRQWLFGLGASAALLSYFSLRNRALSPALAEARLQALQARIRPHFLFNSLNAVLGIMRSDPRRAETALEDLAELFRVLMADNRKLSTLAREVELTRQYLQIEQLRLGPRLQVDWRVDEMPENALVPPLVLQPLVENAVYHGIEPASGPGTVELSIRRSGDQVEAVLRNPYQGGGRHHSGNRMALANIKERLMLHFDEEASLTVREEGGIYEVRIVLPYLTENRG